MLEVQVQRAVVIGLERHPAADGKAFKLVTNLEAFRVVQGDGPEGIDRWRGAGREVQAVGVGAVQRLAVLIAQVQWVDRVFRQVGAQADLGHDGAL
ncbi:hypothetical protein D9M71_570480 [compost metagenome]